MITSHFMKGQIKQINNMIEYIVDEKLAGFRLDKCVASLDSEISREAVQRLIEEKNIFVKQINMKMHMFMQ